MKSEFKKIFTIKGIKNYFKNVSVDFTSSITDSKNSLKRHGTYHQMFIFFAIVFLLFYIKTNDVTFSKLTVVSIIILLVNYLIKVFRFGTKGFIWWKEE